MTREKLFETLGLGEEDLTRLLGDHQKLLVLYGFANAISTILDIELLLHEAMNVVFGLVKAERGAIFLLDSKTGKLVRGVSRIRQTKGKGMNGVPTNTIVDIALAERKAILTTDAMADERFKNSSSVQAQTIRSSMCVPLVTQHRILGILYIDSQTEAGNFSKEELTLVSGIATQTAVAIENIESVSRLKEQWRRVEDILKALPIAILSIDEEGIISFVNPQAEKLFRIFEREPLGRSYHSFFEGSLFEPLIGFITPALQEGKSMVLEEVACSREETQVLLQVNIVPLREGTAQKGVLVALNDVTEKKRLERDIANAEKLSAIGEMTAGLVHEIINPLSIISGRIQLLLLERGKDEEVSKTAHLIREQVDRASGITEKLLSFARERKPQLESLLLNEFLEKFMETMEEQFTSRKITVEKRFATVPLKTLGDPEQLEEVFANLSRNAIQAMPEGGRFILATRKVGDYAEISVTDAGCGISPEHLSKIFVPFFTTKTHGTGLGLSIVHGIVKNHGGVLKVQSQVGKGTTFMVMLPLRKEVSL